MKELITLLVMFLILALVFWLWSNVMGGDHFGLFALLGY